MRKPNSQHSIGDKHGLQTFVSLKLEQSLVEGDYALLALLRDGRREELAQGIQILERLVQENCGGGEMDRLCGANCDREDLLWLLHWFPRESIFDLDRGWLDKPGVLTTKVLLGITPKELTALIRQLNKVATQVEVVNLNFHFGVLLSTSKPLNPLWNLQRFLRAYAVLLQYAATHFGHGAHIYHNIAKARLTTYVLSRTGDFHDREIAALVSSVSDDAKCGYDETAHRVWRRKHYSRLKEVDPALSLHGPMTAHQSPSIPPPPTRS